MKDVLRLARHAGEFTPFPLSTIACGSETAEILHGANDKELQALEAQ